MEGGGNVNEGERRIILCHAMSLSEIVSEVLFGCLVCLSSR